MSAVSPLLSVASSFTPYRCRSRAHSTSPRLHAAINGLGERCGNANLISVIPNLMLKMGFETGLKDEGLERLTRVSRLVDELLNRLGTFFGGENSFDEGVKSPFGFWCAAFQLFVQDRACQAKQDGVHGAQKSLR